MSHALPHHAVTYQLQQQQLLLTGTKKAEKEVPAAL